MATVNSWLFKNRQGKPPFRYEGDINNFPADIGEVKWVKVKDVWAKKLFDGKQPSVMHNGILHFGEPEVIWRQGNDAPCSTNCRNAKGIYCQCSCKGKNHGINNRDMADAIREEDVIYIGWGK